MPAPNGRLERIDLGAELARPPRRREAETLTTYKSYFPSTDPSLGPISRFFEGEATSEVGLHAGLRRDLWTAVAPDIGRLLPRIEQGDEVFADAASSRREQRGGVPRRGAARAQHAPTLDDPPPATFRIIVSPLVTWIWLGALIVFAGGLIAMWPTGSRARKPGDAVQLARVARELQRAA